MLGPKLFCASYRCRHKCIEIKAYYLV